MRRRVASGRRLNKALADIEADGGGIMKLTTFFREDVPGILLEAAFGGDDAALCLLALTSVQKQLRENHPLCLLCDVQPTLDMVRAVTIFAGAGDKHTQTLVNLVCENCVKRIGDRDSVARAARAYYVANIANLRAIDISNQEGNA